MTGFRRVEGIVLDYVRSVGKSVSLNWVVRTLVEMVERGDVSVEDVWRVISDVEANPDNFLLDMLPERRERLEVLKRELREVLEGK
ncbi:MAG: hypothetical protein DRJ63_08400 [Thermoprotei archaeon]|nr:MAG: hypothetical protein DRJ63_08400 [Thermoprotei archaeon]